MRKFSGQSLTEILVALSIGVVFINVGILAMSTANVMSRVNQANNFALSLLKGQKNTLETIAKNDWHSIADLTIGKHYKLAKQNNTWVIQPGEEKAFDEKPPVAQWNFDEGTGTVAYDNVGTNNGTLVSSPTWTASSSCVSGGCLGFDGATNQYVLSGNNVLLNSDQTYSAWVYPRAASTLSGILTTHIHTIPSNIGINIVSNKFSISIGYTDGTREYNTKVSNYSIILNQWTHVVLVYNATENSVIFYINGAFDSKWNLTKPVNFTSGQVLVGQWSAAYLNNYKLNGLVDEAAVYDYALTDNQVKQHYNAGLNRLGLVSQWALDEGSGTTAYDSQGTNDGNLVNGPTWSAASSCVSGNCLSFNGSNNYIDLGTPSSLMTVTYPYTITAWANPSTLSQNGIIISFAPTDSASQIALGIYNTGNQILVGNAGYTYGLSGISSYLKASTWQYWTIVFTDPTHISFYIDGQNKPLSNIAQYYSAINNNIGARQNGGDKWFNGLIDDVRLYNRALSSDEIANQYKDGCTKYFYVNNVSRSITSDPTASTHNLETTYNKDHDDPNTKKIINVTRYLLGASGRVNTQEQYLTRAFNINSMVQNDWSGSSGIEGPTMEWGKDYANASNISTIVPGQISLTSVASSGTLTSSVIDTQSVKGAGYFNLLWKGTLCSSCVVKFQIAASNSITGPWTYYGPTITSDYYTPSGPGVIVPITYAGFYSANAASVQNKRYIRYQITLVPAINTSPTVTSVIINYAP